VIVEFVEDGERRVVTREKKWKLRSRADDEEVDFDSVKEGHKVSAYWSPNRAYYDAAVINVDRGSAYECHQKSVKRTLSLDVNEVAVMRDSSKRIKKSVASMKSDMQKAWSKNLLEAAQTEILTICCM
jgi:hypothetical protein